MSKYDLEWYRNASADELLALDNGIALFIGQEGDSDVDFSSEWWEEVMPKKAYTADFETTTDEEDCRVWAVGICDIEDETKFKHGNSIEWFFDKAEELSPCAMYFHNLGFDGAFIMDWLERHGWRWVETKDDAADMTYATVISDMNQVYCITLYYTPTKSVRIMDSFKIAPLSVAALAKAYNLPVLKGEIDYESPRPIGHILTEEEIAYLRNDVVITALVMRKFLGEGLNRMTAGSNALENYRSLSGGKKGFRKFFPELTLEQDSFIRKAYRGGFTWVNPEFQGRELGEGLVLDVNSLYPSVMSDFELPYGEPAWFEGKPKPIKAHPLWIAQVECEFDLKGGHIPTVQLKGNMRFDQTEYLASSDGAVRLTVTNIDWELMQEHYNLRKVRWFGGYAFKAGDFAFKSYIGGWMKIKEQATKDGNGGMRQIAKLMLNSLYGKFATNPITHGRRPMLVDDVLRYVDLPDEEREAVYLPVAVFTTSYARAKTIRAAQTVKERFVYADTDSLHLVGDELPENLDIDPVKLGAWKHESDFERAKFLRSKCYIEQEKGKDGLTVRIAGMPSKVKEQVTFDNFELGAVYSGKLYTHRVNGGIVLSPGDMELRK